ncbi:MAG: hypothetical protein JWM90_200, partial [Thermoleophilia bacterium]|nr:hypothetical protein [Thermoleophilia bacterium]
PDEVPVITGADATIGTTLSVSDGTWTGLPSDFSFAYQWERCSNVGDNCTAIPDATGNSHTLSQGDLGLTVRAEVTATNVAGSGSATAGVFPDSPDVVIQATDPEAPPAAELRITNTTAPDADPDNPAAPFEGHTLSVDAGDWGGTPTVQFAYQWQLCDPTCNDLAFETESTHVITHAEVGGTLRVIVVGTNPGLNSDTETSNQFPNAGGVVLAAVAPSLSTSISVDDSPERTKVSAADSGTWTGTAPMLTTQQWQRCADAVDVLTCEDITGETLTQYTPTAVDVNDPGTPYFLRLVVTSTNAGGSMIEASPISVNAVGPGIVPTNDVVPSVAGPYAVGTTLTADPGTWSGTVELTYTYQWRRCDPVCHDLPAETQESYMPTVEDEGHQLVVEVTGHNLVGVSAPVASAPVGPVTP